MGSTYGDAWISALYDIDTEVKITNPSEEVRRIHKIEPQKYLVLPGSEIKFPEGVFIGVQNLNYRAKMVVKKISQDSRYNHGYVRLKDLVKCSEGELYPVTLVRRVVNVDTELDAMDIDRFDTSNLLIFEPGSLEKRLASAKAELLAIMETSGLKPDESKIYFELVGSNPRF
ncbi:hypothetical protein HYT25_02525 [Candidatus Pacearchaeota archaeon]|nr:hypothetical protein [Candidatus Pacearchaeota archaeon]